MKAMTIKAPWSWAISHGPKRIENRTWARSYRGPLAIHAGKGWDLDGGHSKLVQRAWTAAGERPLNLMRGYSAIASGAVVAVADLVDICDAQMRSFIPGDCRCGPWAARGQSHWKLANVRPLAEPVPCKGALGLWTLPDDVEAAVVAQLGERTNA